MWTEVEVLTEQGPGWRVAASAIEVGPLKGWENLDCRIPLGDKFGAAGREACALGWGRLPKSDVDDATKLEVEETGRIRTGSDLVVYATQRKSGRSGGQTGCWLVGMGN